MQSRASSDHLYVFSGDYGERIASKLQAITYFIERFRNVVAREVMNQKRPQRRLAAIVAADVVGYSSLIEGDEEGTRALLRALQKDVIEPRIAGYGGRIFKTMGDGYLAEFASAVDAVQSACDIQEDIRLRNSALSFDERMELRIGVNVGDVMIEGEDIHGDIVNIAARLESIAEPGGICVSSKVYDEVKRKIGVNFVVGGVRKLKNIEEPVAVYHVSSTKLEKHAGSAVRAARSLHTHRRPRIAVRNIRTIGGGDGASDLAIGLTEDIRDALAHQTAVAVVDLEGDEDSIDFRLEGSVRSSGPRLRFSFALLEGTERRQVWSDRYDRELDDVFELQDEISQSVAAAIRLRVKAQIFERLKAAKNEELTVSELLDKAAGFMVRGQGYYADIESVLRLALERAPDNPMAMSMLAACLYNQREFSAEKFPEDVREECDALIRDALRLAPQDYFARLVSGIVHYDRDGEFEAALRDARTALDAYPGLTPARAMEGVAMLHMGDVSKGLGILEQAIKSSKMDPNRFRLSRDLAIGYFVAGRVEEAITVAQNLVEQTPGLARNQLVLAVLLQVAGRTKEAREQFARLGDPQTIRKTWIGDASAAGHFEDALAVLLTRE